MTRRIIASTGIVSCLVVASAICVLAQTPQSAQDAAVPPRTIEAAEAEGAAHPARSGIEQSMYADAFGPSDRKCVAAEGHVTARSGDFVAGPFEAYIVMGRGRLRKVWWAPRQGTVMPPLLLRGTKLDGPNVTVAWSFPSVAVSTDGAFYNTTFELPQPGKWLVVVTAGSNWGCFVLQQPSDQ